MKQVKVEIFYTGKNFCAYIKKLRGCVATGATPDEIKTNIREAIDFHIKGSASDGDPLPKEFMDDNFELVYKFNAESLLNYYKRIFTHTTFERLTGIDQRQKTLNTPSHKKLRAAQTKKIKTALHKLGGELMAIEL